MKLIASVTGSLWVNPQASWAQSAVNQHFIIPPTVQHTTEASATIFFRLAEVISNGSLRIFQGEELVQTIPLEPDTLRHQLHLDNLTKSTLYRYEVVADDKPITAYFDEDTWTNLTFKTPPYETPLRFAALGDTGFGDPATDLLVEQIASHDLDFMLHLGDVVYWLHQYNNDHFYNWYKKYFKPFYPILKSMPIYPTMGNHEFDGPARLDDLPSYNWVFPPFAEDNYEGRLYWYTFTLNEIQFICLNSQLIYSTVEIRNAQQAWMEEQLARTDSRYKVIFFHIAPYNSGSVHQWDGQPIAERWIPLFEESNVALVITGHAHIYERLQKNGIHYVVAGSGSSTVYGRGERLATSITLFNETAFPLFELYEDRIHLTAYDKNGQVIEDVDLALPSA